MRRLVDAVFAAPHSPMMAMSERIERRLISSFQPSALAVIDESHLHAGHAHSPKGGESHFRVEISSAAFRGRSRVERQRMVFEALKEEMQDGIHALSIAAVDDTSGG